MFPPCLSCFFRVSCFPMFPVFPMSRLYTSLSAKGCVRGFHRLRMVAHWFAYLVGAEYTLDLTDDAPPFLGMSIPILPVPAVVNMYVPPRKSKSMLVHHMFGSQRSWPAGYPLALLGEPQSRLVRRTPVWPLVQYGTGGTALALKRELLSFDIFRLCACCHPPPMRTVLLPDDVIHHYVIHHYALYCNMVYTLCMLAAIMSDVEFRVYNCPYMCTLTPCSVYLLVCAQACLS